MTEEIRTDNTDVIANACKKISELENKIADIKANCDLAIEGRDVKIMELEQKLEQTEKDLADYQFNYPSIKELEKENSKLLDVINNQDVKIADLEKQIEQIEKVSDYNADQLTKAKEFLQRFIETSNPIYFEEDRQKVKTQAEQFLKEIEK